MSREPSVTQLILDEVRGLRAEVNSKHDVLHTRLSAVEDDVLRAKTIGQTGLWLISGFAAVTGWALDFFGKIASVVGRHI